MTSLLTITFALISVAALASADYRWYYRPPSCRALSKKVDDLKKRVDSMQQPVNIHVDGTHAEHVANFAGSHIHLHLSVDGQQGVSPAALKNEYSYASCYLQPNSNNPNGANGYVFLRQKPNSKLEIKIDLKSLPRSGKHGFHVHELTNYKRGCNSFGGHFNPYGKTHGGPNDVERHVGDWGNIVANGSKAISVTMTDTLASLFGRHSIVGRGIVVHAGVDDLGRGGDDGSKKTGNAGARLACCVIGWDNASSWPLN